MALQATRRAFGEPRLDHEAILRESLSDAERGDKQLILWARSNEAGDMAAAQESLREIAHSIAQPNQPDGANWNRANADHWLWATDIDNDTF